MEVESIKTGYGNVKYFETEEASFSTETILPKKKLPEVYMKRSFAFLIIIKGRGKSSHGILKEGDFVRLKPKEKFWMENESNNELKFLAIDIPPIKDEDIVWTE